MATPTIIIGIGSSGLYVLENVQRFYYETYKTNKPANVEFIYIETNEANWPVGTPVGNSIKRVYISLDNMAEMIKEIKETCDSPAWLPDTKEVLSAGLGAGGIRSCGRLALWGKNQQGDNFSNVINAIKSAYSSVMHIYNDSGTAAKPTVFVTGSVTGGTGSGILIDMAYLVRHLIMGIKDLYGLFLLPPEPNVITGYEVWYGNAYGAIRDLAHYNKVQAVYEERWPNGFSKKYEDPPYELVQFISQDYQDGAPAISTLPGLYKMAGLYLFLNIAGIYDKRRERLVDAKGSSLIGKYGTFGLSAIQFPKDQIEEFVASQQSVELLSKLVNPNEYYQNGQLRPISRPSIRQNMIVQWDDIIERAFGSLNTMEGRDLLIQLGNEATRINKNDIQGSAVEHIISLFNSNKNDNIYAMVSSNMRAAVNTYIDGIYEVVDRNLQASENFYFARYVLEDIVERIEKTLAYWQSIGMSSKSDNWDNKLRELAVDSTRNTHKIVFEQDEVLKDRLNNILELMKIHLSIRPLVDICKHVREGDIQFRGSNHELPKLKLFTDLINNVNALVGKNEQLENSLFSFPKRLNAITADINDSTLPILRVYPSGSFKQECSKASQVYNQRSGGTVRSMRDVIDGENIFSYFKKKYAGRFAEDVYLEVLNAYRNKVEQLKCIEDYNVANYIQNNTDECIRTAKRSISPFLKVNKILAPMPSLPRFITGSDVNDITGIIKSFASKNYFDFKDSTDSKKELDDLRNIIVFYDEKGNFELADDLSYIDMMKQSFENKPSWISDPNMTNERWVNNRSAYKTT